MEFPNEAIVNYIFPNEAHLEWSLMIVIYPYITGLIAGAFVVSALYHVFKMQIFEPIARFALVISFCFGLFAGLPLLAHLGQPQRAFNIFFTPHFTSAMSMFGYIYSAYMLLLTIELWLVYREFIVRKANETGNIIWRIMTLGVTRCTPESARLDQKVISILAGIGIPAAFLLHGYVGFIFGSVKAQAWWATPLQPIVFLMSAIVSGIAALFLFYAFLMWRRKEPCDCPMVKQLMVFLWIAFLADYSLELLEVASAYYEQAHHWSVIGPLLAGPLFQSYAVWQMSLLSLLPIILLGAVAVVKMRERALLTLSIAASSMLVLQVLFMRYNIVIGGQLLSKSDRGFSEFHFQFFTKEGVLTAAMIMILPFACYYFLSRINLPVFLQAQNSRTAAKQGPKHSLN